MDQKLCLSCRAENPVDADFCWKCYATFEGMNAPVKPAGPGEVSGGRKTLPVGTQALTQLPVSRPALTASLMASRAFRYAAIGVGIILVLLGVGHVYGILDPTFPSSIGAYSRGAGTLMDRTEQTARDWALDNRFNVAVQSYGPMISEQSPFTVIRVTQWKDRVTSDQLLLSFADIGSPTILGPDAIQRFKLEGVEYTCVATPVPVGAACQWQSGEDEIVLIVSGTGVQATLALTTQAHAAI